MTISKRREPLLVTGTIAVATVIKRSDKEVGKDIHKESDEEEGVKMN